MERIAVFGMNIVDPILFQARLNPAAPAICVPGAGNPLISYGRLERAIHNIGRAALSSGLARGQIAAIHVQDKIFHAALILGLARIGVVTMSARSRSFPQEVGVDAVIVDANASYQNAKRVIVAEAGAWMANGDGAPLDDPRLVSAGGDDLCRITLTSGSTGDARGIPFTHRLVMERNARLAFTRNSAFQVCSRFYCDLGFATDPGFRDLLRLLYKGGTIFYYGEDPESLVQGLTLYQVQGMMASPEGLSEYLKFYDAYPNIACGLDHIITQGAAMPRALSQHVARACAPIFPRPMAQPRPAASPSVPPTSSPNSGRRRLRHAWCRSRVSTRTTRRCRSRGKGGCACARRKWSAATTATRPRDGMFSATAGSIRATSACSRATAC